MIWSSHLNVFPLVLLSSPESFSILIDNTKVCTSLVWDVVATKYLCSGVIESNQDPPFPQPSALKTLKARHLECGVFLKRESVCLPRVPIVLFRPEH